MFKHFVNLQWKSFFRSSNFGKGLALKIIVGFFAVYMMVSFTVLGIGLYFILQKTYPDTDPMLIVSGYLLYWVLFELFFRYFMQKLPVMDIKPLLLYPITKSKIAHYILARSGLSGYNFLALFIAVPFSVVLLSQGYPALQVMGWLFAIVCIILTINYTNFIINKSDTVLWLLGILILALYGLEYFDVFPVKEVVGQWFFNLYRHPILVLAPLLLAIGTYAVNYNFLIKKLYLDASLKKKSVKVETSDLTWTKRFGDIAPFLQLDLKLIWRNKRTKMQVFISLAMVFYGLFFYNMDSYGETSTIYLFVGIFMTGIFLSNFGQFIPAWDSEYYGMMMSQNIPLRKYLESKAGLISVSIAVMFLLSIPYVYFGWKALALNFACALYNLGVNVPVILFFGSFNKKRIDLTKSAVGNMQGTSATQFLVILPLMVLPSVLYFTLKTFVSFEVALITLSAMGIMGFAFRKNLLDKITEAYRKRKYTMIAGFKEQNG